MRFADHLRTWSPDALAELLAQRPDLLSASDEGFEALARRASTPMSLGRCLVRSDVGMLVVADALAVLHPATAIELDELLGTGDVDGVLDALVRLQERGVVTVENGVASPVGSLDDLLHRPLGLGLSIVDMWDQLPPEVANDVVAMLAVDGARKASATARAVARRMADPSGVAALLDGAPDGTDEVLEELVAQRSPAIGLPAGHLYRDLDTGDPLTWMLGHGILVAVNEGLAELPREVVIAMSPDGLAPGARLRPIEVQPVVGLGADVVAAAAADQAAKALETAEALLRMAHDGEIAVRKVGGVGVREVRRLAKALDAEARDVGRLIELLYQARLIAVTPGQVTTTELSSTWWNLSRMRRWLVLARAWMASGTFLSRALSHDPEGTQVPALSDVDPVAAAFAGRRALVALLATLDDGEAHDPEQLTEAVVWRSPNLWGAGEPPPEELVSWTRTEAEMIGLTAMDATTPILRALAADDHDLVETLAEQALGQDQSQILLQSDLSAVALGPLEPAVAGQLSELSDRVAGLSVPTFRFTEASLRRGFDRGWRSESIERFLNEHALSGLPQPLQYLIADVERRYGSVRVLAASSVIVTEDEAIAVEIASTTRAARIGLRLIAPTVLVGPVDPHQMVEELRAEGLFPILDGMTVSVGGGQRDVGLELDQGLPADWTGPSLADAALPGEVSDAVAALLAADASAESDGGGDSELGHRLHLLWNRAALVNHLRDGELVEVRGILLGVDETLTLLNESGIEEVPIDSVISVEDPTR